MTGATGDRAASITAQSQPLTLQQAYAACRAFTKRRATNFYYAFVSLPKRKRNAIYAAYAFAGTVDDAVDEAGDAAERGARLRRAHELLARAYDGAPSPREGDAWLEIALADAVSRYDIPRRYFLDLMAGMEQDIAQTRFRDYAELEAYCYRAASVIGLICTEIFGYDHSRRDEAVAAAIDMGKAMQVTNIMRDVKEDAQRDRIYLALEDLRAFGYSEEDLKAGVYNDAFRRLMQEYARRALALYEGGLRLLPLLDDRRSRMCCNGLQGVYRGILDAIIDRDYDVYSERVSLSTHRRLFLLLRLWIGGAWPQRRLN